MTIADYFQCRSSGEQRLACLSLGALGERSSAYLARGCRRDYEHPGIQREPSGDGLCLPTGIYMNVLCKNRHCAEASIDDSGIRYWY